MPNIATSFGVAQSIGIGFGLLLFTALRARRYHSKLARTYVPIWLAACIGLAIYSSVERHIDLTHIAYVVPLIFLLPALSSLLLGRFIGKR
jgi:hypothetical protein